MLKCKECDGDLVSGVHSSKCSLSLEAQAAQRTKELLESTVKTCEIRLQQVIKLCRFLAEVRDGHYPPLATRQRARALLEEIGGYEND